VQAHPGVLEAAVVVRPDQLHGEVPVVLVVLRDDPDHPVEVADLIELLGRSFARWQLPEPEDVHFVASLPRSGVGKLNKKAIRRMLLDV
jgi:acyl-CoA synthetase (AMP-forming)/AMP-acid ligase II